MGHTIRRTTGSLLLAAAIAGTACGPTAPYRPYFDEGGSGASIDEFTYVSSALTPKTITVVDTRTEEPVFAMDIPAGQQLVVNFDERDQDRGKYLSGTMRWAVMDAGDRYGSLKNRVAVPPPHARRIDMTIRQGPEVAVPPQVETMTPPPLTDSELE